MSCDRYARMIIKTGQGVPTIPASADHRNGDWLDTDIYEGELYMDTDTGMTYTRNGTDIITTGAAAECKIYRANLSQAGTGDPTADEYENTIGAIVWTRNSAGNYQGLLTGAFTANKTWIVYQARYNTSGDYISNVLRWDSDKVYVQCRDSIGNGVDDVLDATSIEIRVYA